MDHPLYGNPALFDLWPWRFDRVLGLTIPELNSEVEAPAKGVIIKPDEGRDVPASLALVENKILPVGVAVVQISVRVVEELSRLDEATSGQSADKERERELQSRSRSPKSINLLPV